MPWYEKEHPTPVETNPMPGLEFLMGDVLARQYQQPWIEGKKYPVITYPSGLKRELVHSSDEVTTVNIFGAFELSTHSNMEEGFNHAADFADEYGYQIERRGVDELFVFHPQTRLGYSIQFDNLARQIVDIRRVPTEAMDLLDGEYRAVLPKLYANEKLGLDAIAPVKFFTPDANWTWYPTEYDGADTLFGLVAGFELELGYFSLTELEGIRGPFGLHIERDNFFSPITLRELQSRRE